MLPRHKTDTETAAGNEELAARMHALGRELNAEVKRCIDPLAVKIAQEGRNRDIWRKAACLACCCNSRI